MKKMIKFLKAFSLVELMISLIVISLISAAFAPVITKKLSNGIITVGSFGGNNNSGNSSGEVNCPSNITCEAGYYLDGTCKCQACSDQNCTYCAHNICSICNDGFTLINGKCENLACHDSGGLPTKACCESIGAMFIDKKYTGTTDLCMMKYNAGDEENTYRVGMTYKVYHPKYPKIGVQINQAGVATCTSSGNCCWKGKTSDGVDIYPGYSASNRTVCQYEAAKKICNNWAFPGTKQGSWRLLTTTEAQKLGTAITAETSSAPVLSKYMGSEGLQLCDNVENNNWSNNCPHSKFCLGSIDIGFGDNTCRSNDQWLNTAGRYLYSYDGEAGLSSNTISLQSALSVRCVTANVNKVISPIDVELSNYNDVEPRYQQDCPEGTLFINKKYTGTSNLCMMKYNATDDRYATNGKPYHPPYAKFGVKVVDTNVECSTGSCCWRGKTSDGTTIYTNYSADNRSVCQYPAAKEICANWAYANSKAGHWRLMTTAEAETLSKYINVDGYYPGSEPFSFLTKYLDGEGLQLCDTVYNNGSNQCPHNFTCKGAVYSDGSYDNQCRSNDIWLNTTKEYFTLNEDTAHISTTSVKPNPLSAYSVRCVSDNIRKEIKDKVETYQPNEPRNQADCDKYSALFIDKKFLNVASKNICMIKYNFADKDAQDKGKPHIGNNTVEDYANIGVNMVEAGQNCTSGKCCWRGKTSSGSGTYSYNPNNRTVCQYEAAKKLCSSWTPDNASSKKWRLLTVNEATGMAKYINAETKYSSFLTKYMDGEGLQLCDSSSSDYGSNRCPQDKVCVGADTESGGAIGACRLNDHWLNTTEKGFYQYKGNTGITSTYTPNPLSAYSVRCVSDTVEWAK